MQLNIQVDESTLYAQLGKTGALLEATRNLLHRCVAVMTPDQLAAVGISVAPDVAAAATPEATPNGHSDIVGSRGLGAAVPALPSKKA